MVRPSCELSLVILVLSFITGYEAVAPLFLQAITSALATIPFTGGPMTTSLIGAKLGIGTKLLYYLGYFGRRSVPKPKPTPMKTTKPSGLRSGFPTKGGFRPMPLPYAFAGAGQFQQMGGFGGGGFDQPVNFQQQMPTNDFGPAQIFQALRAQGFDENTAMQIISSGGGFGMNAMNTGGFGMNSMNTGGFGMNAMGGGFGSNQGFSNIPQGDFSSGFNSEPIQVPNTDTQGLTDVQTPSSPADTQEHGDESDDIESFFTFLKDMDENTCISRLICDIGADPSFLGEFSENIHGIVGTLDVQPSSGAYPYIEIMETGRQQGDCVGRFPRCGDAAYEIVKNVAPSVGVPQNINVAAINNL